MKSIKVLAMTVVGLLFSTMSFADDIPIPVSQLPAPVKTFVKKHFQGKTIAYAEKDYSKYECHLSDGTQVDFYRNGTWKKVDTEYMSAVPGALVPATIKQYVKSSFPGMIITKIEKEHYGYDIELSNDFELKFNRQGVLLRMEGSDDRYDHYDIDDYDDRYDYDD